MTRGSLPPWQHKALTKLLELTYKLVYKKARRIEWEMLSLSRIIHADIHDLAAISVAQSTWLNDLHSAYLQDPKSAQLLQELIVHSPLGPFKLTDGLIYYQSQNLGRSSTNNSIEYIECTSF